MSCHNEAIETITKGIFTLEIFQDDSHTRPDKDMDCAGELIRVRDRLEDLTSRELIKRYGNIVFERIDNSDRWEKWYWTIDRDTWIKEWGKGKAGKDGAKKYAKGIVEMFDQWINGEIYGYVVSALVETDSDGDPDPNGEKEEKDSCWGFYGMDHVMKEGKSVLSDYVKQETEAQAFEAGAMAL